MEFGLLHQLAFVSQSKAILLYFVLLLLLMFAFPHLETLMPTMWHAFTGFLERPAFGFLLLNCLIVTIIASSKLESEKGELHEEATLSKRESMRQLMEKGDEKRAFTAENAIRRGINIEQSHNSSITNGIHKDLVGSSCSLNANYKKHIIRQKPIDVNGRDIFIKPVMRARQLAACTGSDLKEKKLMKGGSHAKPARELKSYDNSTEDENCNKGLGRAEEPAAASKACPSLEEVWEAIMLTKTSDDRMPAYMQAPPDQLCKGSNEIAAAPRIPVLARAPPLPPVAARIPPAAVPNTVPLSAPADVVPAAAAIGADHEDDSELEELNRRAEEFIARFNHQMRLQRQESLQSKSRRRHEPCNYSNLLQLPAPALLVG